MEQRYPNPHKFPSRHALAKMSARDLGLMLLPVLTQQKRSFVPCEVIRVLVDQYSGRGLGVEDLLLEGVGYLETIGYLAEAMSWSMPARMLTVTRAGRAASREANGPNSHAAAASPVAEVLDPVIATEALPEIERGPDHFQDAIFKAYRAVEIAVRDASGLGNEKIGVPLMNAAFGPSGPLREPDAEGGEAEALRNLFAGALGAFRTRCLTG